ncbi:MOSC N-terminal beta barrel domain-containing protein [Orrella sp. JC864]|uniref:MOSC domain-containing protein n=1 Tax=Orrella sp. JC864 TaxID=3120298 RepID=UPI003008B454
MNATLVGLHSYPIKSCGALDWTVAAVTAAGLALDRQWMLVSEDGRFMTQRQWPAMALVRPVLRENALWVGAPGMPELRVAALDEAPPEGPARTLTVWRDNVPGQDAGAEAAAWFSNALGEPCRLYRLHPQARRLASPEHVTAWRLRHGQAVPELGSRHAFGFADGFPLLVASQDSLRELNARLARQGHAPVPMDRFRPNVVIEGLEPYDEDHVAWLRCGQVVLALVKPCSRCTVPDVDQASGLRGEEPGRTLAAYRRRQEGVMFGQNAVAHAPAGAVLAVGEPVRAEFAF